jgi:predicted negative regulator of RcsB-dependent stress response
VSERSPAVIEHLGDLYEKQGRKEEARAEWQKALSLSPGDEQAKRLRAKLDGGSKK